MKAVLALIALYVVAFLVAVGSASQSSQPAKPDAAAAQEPQGKSPVTAAIAPAKEADIRALIELTGATDLIQDAADKSGGQYTERITTLMPDKDRAQKLSAAFLERYKTHFTSDEMTDQLVRLYDKHFTADEIKGLLQFYGSPLGQKVAAEMPRLTQEIQTAGQMVSQRAAKEAWQDLREQNPDLALAQRADRVGRRRP
jgi:hypothetical protein